MQTFLPYADFQRSMSVLDRYRLGRQRLEALILARGLSGLGPDGWRHHPAWKMWAGHEMWLAAYGLSACEEWVSRGYRDGCRPRFMEVLEALDQGSRGAAEPPWLGGEAFHLSHQSNLVRKKPDHYAEIFPGVPDDLPYVWPVR